MANHDFLKKTSAPIVISLLISSILHVIFIALASGLGAFDFSLGRDDVTLTALLIPENNSKLKITSRAKSNRAAPSKKVSSAGDDNVRPVENKTGVKEDAVIWDEAHGEDAHGVEQVSGSSDEPAVISPETTGLPGSSPGGESASSAKTEPYAAGRKIGDDLPQNSLEKLSFSIYWLGIYVGRAELEAVRTEGAVTIKCEVHSAPVISVFYRVEDYSQSKLVNGVPVNFRIKQHEGKYRSNKETFFDLDNKHVRFIDNLKGTKDDFTVKGGDLWDVISGFYYLRTQTFEIGQTIYMDIFDSKKFYNAEINVLGKEQIKVSDNRELNTVKVKPILKSEGLFQNKGDIVIWLTDDDDRLPVRIETRVPIGTVIVVLSTVETN
jgi:hypothetical protein